MEGKHSNDKMVVINYFVLISQCSLLATKKVKQNENAKSGAGGSCPGGS